ncbi:class D sortase [Sporosarcina sp. BI001-red]|uniref:class D sortase n=1 Tax=Sporosarcina sp. BI001-red TaxID=2282866 RepID=UPI000E21E3DB|nr:class D sortase [Sporosarcina sp. BI001-red]REB08700.1 class D sortase [Sporosarcina sp. BI001-red]
MKRTARWIGNFLLLAGVGLLVWQFVGTKHTENVREQQLDAFANLKAEAKKEIPSKNRNSTESLEQTKETATAKEVQGKKFGELVGVLSIPQIDIHAPVSYGATPSILDSGFGAIPSEYEPGVQNGSYAIAGHQSHVFGQFFNRLDELQEGSRIDLETVDESQTYEVYEMRIVLPEEVEAIEEEPGIAKLSLVTCYPHNSNKHRLIVMAKRVGN